MKSIFITIICLALFGSNFSLATEQKTDKPKIEKVSSDIDFTKVTGGFWWTNSKLEKCARWKFADGWGLQEWRTVTDQCCICTPIGCACSNCPKCETQWCVREFYVQVCYDIPDDALVEKCVVVGAAAAILWLPNVPAAEQAFKEAFLLCVGSGTFSIAIQEEKKCDGWHNCTKSE